MAGVQWVCLAGYMRLLSADFVSAFPERILNIHPSLLPAFPGLHVQRKALEYGVPQYGWWVPVWPMAEMPYLKNSGCHFWMQPALMLI